MVATFCWSGCRVFVCIACTRPRDGWPAEGVGLPTRVTMCISKPYLISCVVGVVLRAGVTLRLCDIFGDGVLQGGTRVS